MSSLRKRMRTQSTPPSSDVLEEITASFEDLADVLCTSTRVTMNPAHADANDAANGPIASDIHRVTDRMMTAAHQINALLRSIPNESDREPIILVLREMFNVMMPRYEKGVSVFIEMPSPPSDAQGTASRNIHQKSPPNILLFNGRRATDHWAKYFLQDQHADEYNPREYWAVHCCQTTNSGSGCYDIRGSI